MKTRNLITGVSVILSSLILMQPALAALSISWFTVDGGGGVSTSNDGRFSVTGTVGQPDAGQLVSNDNQFLFNGGFWYGEVLFCGCTLAIAQVNGSVTVSWPCQLNGCILEYTDALASPPSAIVWSPVNPQPVGQNYTFNANGAQRYFRLRAP